MTPDNARAFADEIQARADALGDRTGEGVHLGKCASVIRSLAAQVEALTPAVDEIPVILDPIVDADLSLDATAKPRRRKKILSE